MVLSCEYCSKEFKNPKRLENHSCDKKYRALLQLTKVGKISLQYYQKFFYINYKTINITWSDFSSSKFFKDFVKYADYMVAINSVHINLYFDYLLQNKVKVSQWASDSTYNIFLKKWNKIEPMWESFHKSLVTTVDWTESSTHKMNEYFTLASRNVIIDDIICGKISPWLLYSTNAGISWLDSLYDEEISTIYEYIDPAYWTDIIKNNNDKEAVSNMLKELGFD